MVCIVCCGHPDLHSNARAHALQNADEVSRLVANAMQCMHTSVYLMSVVTNNVTRNGRSMPAGVSSISQLQCCRARPHSHACILRDTSLHSRAQVDNGIWPVQAHMNGRLGGCPVQEASRQLAVTHIRQQCMPAWQFWRCRRSCLR